MLRIPELIKRCQTNDQVGWSLLFDITQSAARYSISSLLRAYRLDSSFEEDVLQELFLHLQARCYKRLRAFRGTSEAELRVFLRKVACRFARKLIAQWVRTRQREKVAKRHVTPPLRDGPTENEIESARQELESVMSPADREKLRHLTWNASASPSEWKENLTPSSPVPQRTMRKWRLDLFRKYADRFHPG